MALAGTDRGSGTHNSSALSFTLNPGSNFTAGAVAVLCLSVDNSDSNGTAHSTFTVTDSLGNTWTRRTSPLYDPGAASAGVAGAIFVSNQNGGTLQTGTTITVTFDANCTAKAWTLMEVTAGAGLRATYQAQGVGTGSATASPTVTTASLTNGDMVIGMVCNEYGTAQTPTGDSDTSNGSWSTMQTAEVGTTAAGQTIITQRKVVTATATQTYNPTLGTSSDCIAAWISLRELPIESIGTLSVTLGAATLSGAGKVDVIANNGTGGNGATLVQTSGKRNASWNATSRTENAASSFTVGNTVIVSMGYYGAEEDLSSVVIAGTTATRAIRSPATWGTGQAAAIIYFAKIANASRTDVVMNNAGSGAHIATLSIDEWSGLQDSPLDKAVLGGPTTSTAPTVTSGTLAQADEVCYFVATILNSVQSSITNPTDYTSVWEELTGTTNLGGEGYYRIVEATTSQAPQSTLATSDEWRTVIATFKAAPSGSTTLEAATLSGAGTVADASGAVGTLNVTLGAMTPAAAGTLAGPIGTFSLALAALAISAAAVLGPPVGTLSATLGAATMSATGTVSSAAANGDLGVTLAPSTASATATVSVQGASSNTLGTLAVSSAATIGPPVGTLSATLGAATISGSAVLGPPVANLSATLGAMALSGVAQVPSQGTFAATLGSLAVSSDGTVGSAPAVGDLSSTLGTLAASGAGSVAIQATATPTLGALTSTAEWALSGPVGTFASVLGALSLSGAGAVDVVGDLSATLGTLTATGASQVSVAGTSSASLDVLTFAGSAGVQATGTANATLGMLTLAASGGQTTGDPRAIAIAASLAAGDITASRAPFTIQASPAASQIVASRPGFNILASRVSFNIQGD